MDTNEPTTSEGAPPQAAPAATTADGAPPAVNPRQLRLLLAGVAVAALVALLWPRPDGKVAPDGHLLDAAGNRTALADRLAPVTLLHFWSTWCPPCIEETPAITRLARDLETDPRFTVLMVAVADEVEKVESFPGITAERVLYDPEWELAHRYGTEQLPETYLLVGGRVERTFVGAVDWDDPQVRALLQRAIGAAPAAG